MKQKKINRFLSNVFIVIVLIAVLFPFAWLLISSFKFEKDIISYPPSIFSDSYTFENYIKVWTTIPLMKYIINTVIFAGGVVITSVFFDSLAGYAFARMNFKGKNFFLLLCFSDYVDTISSIYDSVILTDDRIKLN